MLNASQHVHGDIRHLEIRLLNLVRKHTVHGDIRHLEMNRQASSNHR